MALRVEIREDHEVFDELAPWWNRQPGPQRSLFLRSEWFRLLATHMLEPSDMLRIVVLRDGDDPVAVLPMFRSGRRLRSLSGIDTEEFDVISGDEPLVADRIVSEMAKTPFVRFEALEETSPLYRAASGRRRWLIDYETKAGWVDLSAGMDAVMDYIGKRQRSNVRRGMRNLEKEGEVRIEPHPAPDRVFEVLEASLDLEAAGWKGEEGVSVRQSPWRLPFFLDLARLAEDEGWLRLGAMYLDDRLVAFNFDLEYAGRLIGLLTSYDEELPSRCSVGHVLLWKTLETCLDRGVVAYALGSAGGENAWKLRWAAETSPRYYVTGFGDGPRGMAAHALWRGRATLRSARG